MEGLFRSFVYGGSTAEDYYYVYDARGNKKYYSRRKGHVIAASNISNDIIGEIKERSGNLPKAKLLQQKQSFLEKIKQFQDKIAEIDRKLEGQEGIDHEAELKEEKARDEASKEREKEERRRFFEKLFGNAKSEPPPKKRKAEDPGTPQKDLGISQEFLKSLQITTKKEWKQWLLKNHPDKGGKDAELCEKVIGAGRSMGW